MRKRSFVKAGKPANGGLLLGYARVSKGDEQSNELQAKVLRAAGCRRIFEEAASGGRWDRPELHRLLDQLREGDTLVVWKLDRLSRSLKDVLHIMERITRAGAGFRSLTEAIDTTTPAGRMMMQMVGSFAEFERAMIRERTSAGLAAARAAGRVGGRRKKLDAAKRREIAESVLSGRKSGAEMARLYSISQPTVSRIVAQHRMAGPWGGSIAEAGRRGGSRDASLKEAAREEDRYQGPVEAQSRRPDAAGPARDGALPGGARPPRRRR
jgi:DNA invertase Pin-like site-specific DNA recombinase